MSERRVLFLQKSLIGTCALVALLLLGGFYMVVSDAVHRGPRLASVDPAAQQTMTTATVRQGTPRGNALLARVGN